MNRQEMLLRYEQHRDNAEELLQAADGMGDLSDTSVNLAIRANAHATLALLYLTDVAASP